MGQNIYMLPSDMNLKIKTSTVRYNNKILVSDEKFSLGKNENVNETPKISHQSTITQAQKPNITHVLTQAQKPTRWSRAPAGPHTYELAKKPTHNEKNCSSTGSGRWFYNMEYVSIRQNRFQDPPLAVLPFGTLTIWDSNHLGF